MVRTVSSKKPLVNYCITNKKLLNQQRSILLFYSAIKSEKTKLLYENMLDGFLRHFARKEKDLEK